MRPARRALLPALALLAVPAGAQTHVEADAAPFALRGFSLHAGRAFDRLRVDAGAFGLRPPERLRANEGWATRAYGASLRLDVVRQDGRGPFAGVAGSVARATHTLERTGGRGRETQWTVGPRVGYRWHVNLVGEGMYVAPSLGYDYTFNPRAVVVDGTRYLDEAWTLTPRLGFGVRF
jgi:hypothetical protein